MANKGTSKAWSLDFHDLEGMMKRYKKMEVDIKPATEKALKRTHAYVTENLDKHTSKQFFPAGGKYSEGDTKNSIVREDNVRWIGSQAYIGVGYNVAQDITSIYLMYGTPRMPKVQAIYNDVWGRKTRTKVRDIQLTTFDDELFDELYKRGKV